MAVEQAHIFNGVDKRVGSGTHHQRKSVSVFTATFKQVDSLIVVEARGFGSRAKRYQEIDTRFHLSLNACSESVVIDLVVFERSKQRCAASC